MSLPADAHVVSCTRIADVKEADSSTSQTLSVPRPEPVVKYVLDYLLALVLFVLALPVILALALVMKLTSRGPVFYCQTRLGKNGRPYTLFKIRTMRVDSEKNGACWSLPGDTRITRLGKFLRKTHLDELPQLWNVLRGEMSLVGPRPERPEFVPGLAAQIPHYRDRLLIRPGVTGLAQVQAPADTGLDSVRIKLTYDLWYLDNCGLFLDLRIMLATAVKLTGVSFATLRAIFRFPSPALVEQAYHAIDSTDSNPNIVLSGSTTETVVEQKPLLPAFASPMLFNSPERA